MLNYGTELQESLMRLTGELRPLRGGCSRNTVGETCLVMPMCKDPGGALCELSVSRPHLSATCGSMSRRAATGVSVPAMEQLLRRLGKTTLEGGGKRTLIYLESLI